MSEEYVRIDRLLVVVQFVLIPIYFFSLSNFMPIIKIPLIWEISNFLNDFIIRFLIPILFSLPLVLFTWYKRYILADTYEQISTTIWRLPTGIKAFYGFNFLIITIFGLPLFSPLIGLLGGYFVGILIFGDAEEEPNIARKEIRLFTTIYLPFALFFALIFYIQVGSFFGQLIQLWEENIDIMYLSALNLADAVILTSLIVFLFELRQKYDYSTTIPPFMSIIAIITFLLLEGALLGFYLSNNYMVPSEVNTVFSIIHISAFIINLGLIFLRWLLHLNEDSSTGTSIYAWITIFIFQIVNVASEEIQLISRTGAILLTCVVFLGLFFLTFRQVSKNY